jgi:hypothetical protein
MQLAMRISLGLVAAATALAPGKVAPPTKTALARKAASTAAAIILAAPTVSYAAICDYAPTSDLCAQERQREALKPKAKGDKGKAAPAFAVAKPVAKPAPPPVKLTKEAQAVADAEATIAKMEKQKKDMTAQFEAQKAKVDAMPEVKEMMKMKGQMESAVKDYDSSVPRMKAKLPAMKEVRDKKAKKDKFVAQNKARREKKERDAKAAQKKARAPRPYCALRHRRDASYPRRPRTRNAPTRRRGKRRRRSKKKPTRRRKRSRAAARAGRRSRGCFNYTLLTKLIRVARRPPRRAPSRKRRHDGALESVFLRRLFHGRL